MYKPRRQRRGEEGVSKCPCLSTRGRGRVMGLSTLTENIDCKISIFARIVIFTNPIVRENMIVHTAYLRNQNLWDGQ